MKENKLVYLIRYAPTLIVVIFAIVVFSLSVQETYLRTNQEIYHIKSDIIEEKKATLKAKVSYVNNQLNYLEQTKVKTLNESIKRHTHRAHEIVNQLYLDNPHLNKEEFIQLVRSTLKNYRFNQGRGYVFIYDYDGTVIFHPIFPHSEGKSMWNFRDAKGNYVAHDLTKKAIELGEAYHRWWFMKPSNPSVQVEKVGYIASFSPYSWYIGTSDFISEVQSDIQNDALEWLTSFHLDKKNNFYVINERGDVLAHTTPRFIGTNVHNIENKTFRHQVLNLLDQSHVYTRHYAADNYATQNLSYVIKNRTWGWTLGASFSATELERLVAEKHTQLVEARDNEIIRLAFLYSIVVALVGLCSYYASNRVSCRFESYQAAIQSDFEKLNLVNSNLDHLASHDQLTGLPNRHHFNTVILKELEHTKRSNTKLLIGFIDIDNFKTVNDYYGHTVGDDLLIKVSQHMKDSAPEGASFYRFGGDEFIITIDTINDAKEAEKLLSEFHRKVRKSYVCLGHEFDIDVTIGGAIYPDHGETLDELLACSDIMLHSIKSQGKGDSALFESTVSLQNQRKFEIEEQLIPALMREEIYLEYQPQICLRERRVWGVEALARWTSPTLGVVYPDEFISVAEATGKIHQLGWYLIERAYDEFFTAVIVDREPLCLSLNLSSLQIVAEGFAEQLIEFTNARGIDPKYVCLETTESVFIKNIDEVIAIFSKLRIAGFHLSIDDFGTGYSSLSYIARLPVNELKIDRSFICQISESDIAQALLSSIVAIGKSTGLRTVAEGVETEEQLAYLKYYDCDIVQGYYFSKPIEISVLKELIPILVEKLQCIEKTSIS